MRNIFLTLAVVSLITACNSKSKTEVETSRDVMSVDTSGLYNSGASTDTGILAEIPETAPVVNKSDNLTTARKKASVKPVVRAPKPAPSSKSENAGTTNTSPANDTSATSTPVASTPAEVKEKKGMSSAAKGAIIGGVGGAVGGAIISKKKGKGAIIGGAVGAAGGYILGRRKDKKNQADTTQ